MRHHLLIGEVVRAPLEYQLDLNHLSAHLKLTILDLAKALLQFLVFVSCQVSKFYTLNHHDRQVQLFQVNLVLNQCQSHLALLVQLNFEFQLVLDKKLGPQSLRQRVADTSLVVKYLHPAHDHHQLLE